MVEVNNRIDPTCHYCICGVSWKPKLRHKLLMLLFGGYSRKCPQCGTVMKFVLVHHVVKTETNVIKNRDRIWENG